MKQNQNLEYLSYNGHQHASAVRGLKALWRANLRKWVGPCWLWISDADYGLHQGSPRPITFTTRLLLVCQVQAIRNPDF